MLYRLKRISAHQGYYSCHFFVWYMASIAIMPYNAYRTLFFIALSAVLIMVYVSFPSLRLVGHSYKFPRKKGILRIKLPTHYEAALLSMLVATVFGSSAAVLVAHVNYLNLEGVLIFFLAFSGSVLISIKYYALSAGSHEGDEKGMFSGVVKIFSSLFFQ